MVEPAYRSVEAKLGRADEHLRSLSGEIAEWANNAHHSFVPEVNEGYTRHALVAVYDGQDSILSAGGLIFSDCINNLRTALDHLVYAISRYQAFDQGINVERNCFIIANSLKKFEDNKKQLAGLLPAVITAIEQVQPFNRPDPILPPLLALLQDLSNTDKHRVLKIAKAAVVNGHVKWEGHHDSSAQVHLNFASIENNTEVCVVTTERSAPHFTFTDAVAFMQIAVWHAPRDRDIDSLRSRTGCTVLLRSLIDEVKYIVEHVKAAVP